MLFILILSCNYFNTYFEGNNTVIRISGLFELLFIRIRSYNVFQLRILRLIRTTDMGTDSGRLLVFILPRLYCKYQIIYACDDMLSICCVRVRSHGYINHH